jgi:hypothetical protein
MEDGPVIKNGFFTAIKALFTAHMNVSPALQIFSSAAVVSRISIQALAMLYVVELWRSAVRCVRRRGRKGESVLLCTPNLSLSLSLSLSPSLSPYIYPHAHTYVPALKAIGLAV